MGCPSWSATETRRVGVDRAGTWLIHLLIVAVSGRAACLARMVSGMADASPMSVGWPATGSTVTRGRGDHHTCRPTGELTGFRRAAHGEACWLASCMPPGRVPVTAGHPHAPR